MARFAKDSHREESHTGEDRGNRKREERERKTRLFADRVARGTAGARRERKVTRREVGRPRDLIFEEKKRTLGALETLETPTVFWGGFLDRAKQTKNRESIARQKSRPQTPGRLACTELGSRCHASNMEST